MERVRFKGGKRKDLNDIYFRSKSEANYARYLKFCGIKFEYEPRTFYFPTKRGISNYTPDFYIENKAQWIEFKGWLDPKSIVRLKRFKKYYPCEFKNLTIVKEGLCSKDMLTLLSIGFKYSHIQNYSEIMQISRMIPSWER